MFSKYFRKRHPLTLIEVVVAALLCSLIFTFLTQTYMNTQKQRMGIDLNRQQVLISNRIYLRLMPIFSHLQDNAQTDPLKTQHFNDALGEGLSFTFDNGVDPSPEFCDRIKGALFLDKQQRLALRIEGAHNTKREEILCEGVQSLRFSLFDPKQKRWKDHWDGKDREVYPKMVKLQLAFHPAKPNLEWVFFTHLENEPINLGAGT